MSNVEKKLKVVLKIAENFQGDCDGSGGLSSNIGFCSVIRSYNGSYSVITHHSPVNLSVKFNTLSEVADHIVEIMEQLAIN